VWENERRSARLYGKVDNLFNQRYYQNGWLAAGATAIAGIGYSF
jgi:outer membrane receptor protein involved in Fe transport